MTDSVGNIQKIEDDNEVQNETTSQPNQNVNLNNEYDPHRHRDVEHKTSNTQALVHILKGCIGTSFLSLPQAFHYAGYVSAVVGIVFIACLTWYCWRIMFQSKYILCQRHRVPSLTYSGIMEKALEGGPPFLRKFSFLGRPVVDTLLIMQQVGVCCVYSVFVPAHFKQIFDAYVMVWDVKIFNVIFTIPWLFLICIPSLKHLAPVAMIANLCALFGIVIIFYFILKDGLRSPSKDDGFVAFGLARDFPIYFSIALFATNPIGILNAIENSMDTPKAFSKIKMTALSIIATLYSVFGVLGLLRYGRTLKPSIALNLPSKQPLSEVAKIVYALSVFITYALQAFIPLQIIWQRFMSKRCSKSTKKVRLLWQLLLRVFFVLFTCVLAILIPYIHLFIALISSLSLSLLGVALPGLLTLCVQYEKKLNWKTISVNVIIMIIGILNFFFGTYFSIYNIISAFRNG